ncbi:BolA family protein [Alteromonas lipotrueae]|uniref:BolA family protein n=1 Tax=Alteromonas lipotrueae TaxID=2803814 RepID=UPI001C465367|nr:BolA/IbaG family iron-sulfur metabolism protein [Alteromonas lipotrueae]
MNVKEFIESTLTRALSPALLNVEDESFMHNVPDGAQSHFKVTVVTDAFEGKRLIARHREINTLVDEALKGPVHALALHTYTPTEWVARGGEALTSPVCLGGSKS